VNQSPNFIEKFYFFSGVINNWISITKYLCYQYGVTEPTAVARSKVTFVGAINENNNKVVLSADDRVLIKLLRQRKGTMLKSLSQNLTAICGHCPN